jgi:hypothetical protein
MSCVRHGTDGSATTVGTGGKTLASAEGGQRGTGGYGSNNTAR